MEKRVFHCVGHIESELDFMNTIPQVPVCEYIHEVVYG